MKPIVIKPIENVTRASPGFVKSAQGIFIIALIDR